MSYGFNFCPKCGDKVSPEASHCMQCGDMVCVSPHEEDPAPKIALKLLAFIIIVCLFFVALSIESNPPPSSHHVSQFDISNGAERYKNWYRDNNIYRTDYLSMTAFIERVNYGARVVFIEKSSTCTESESSGYSSAMEIGSAAVPMTPVKFVKHCYSRGWVAYTPYDENENNIVVQAFKKSNNVWVDLWDDAVFSAIGFTDAYEFMSQ